jgi:hypothetical protein
LGKKLLSTFKFARFTSRNSKNFNAIRISSTRFPQNLNHLFEYYGSDKGSLNSKPSIFPWEPHSYGAFYDFIFHPIKEQTRNLFECGIGTNNTNIASNMGLKGQPGASLRAWRDYFPNANIYGVDIDHNILINEPRIHTDYLDQTDSDLVKNYFGRLRIMFDIMIDDGLHTYEAGINLFNNSINYLTRFGYYIIEDIADLDLVRYLEYFSTRQEYSYVLCQFAKPMSKKGDDNLIIIQFATVKS